MTTEKILAHAALIVIGLAMLYPPFILCYYDWRDERDRQQRLKEQSTPRRKKSPAPRRTSTRRRAALKSAR